MKKTTQRYNQAMRRKSLRWAAHRLVLLATVIASSTLQASGFVVKKSVVSCLQPLRTTFGVEEFVASAPEVLVSKSTRPEIFDKTNYQFVSLEGQNQQHVWKSLVPPVSIASVLGGKQPLESVRSLDVSVKFENSADGARALLDKCGLMQHGRLDPTSMKMAQDQLSAIFYIFSSIIPNSVYKARIVATRGSYGEKCPRWHVDHVPVRCLVSLVGPGCMFVDGEAGIDRSVLNGLDVEDNHLANGLIVKIGQAKIRSAPEGSCIMLMGREWETPGNMAVVHKSPNLKSWDGRVLLSLDVA